MRSKFGYVSRRVTLQPNKMANGNSRVNEDNGSGNLTAEEEDSNLVEESSTQDVEDEVVNHAVVFKCAGCYKTL